MIVHIAKKTQEKEKNDIHSAVFTYFGCTINILDRKDYAQAIEQDLSQGRDELRGGHQDIHTVWPVVDRQRRWAKGLYHSEEGQKKKQGAENKDTAMYQLFKTCPAMIDWTSAPF